MYIEVAEFNKKRNQLELPKTDGKTNITNELLMIREEIREFWDATTVAERLDAYIDTKYVWLGTQIKASYNTSYIPDELYDGVGRTLRLMEDMLIDELEDDFFKCEQLAEKIVCRVNSHKTNKKDENGKVIKGDIEDATKSIALMIEEVTKPTSY